jgi:hypothetical protein
MGANVTKAVLYSALLPNFLSQIVCGRDCDPQYRGNIGKTASLFGHNQAGIVLGLLTTSAKHREKWRIKGAVGAPNLQSVRSCRGNV